MKYFFLFFKSIFAYNKAQPEHQFIKMLSSKKPDVKIDVCYHYRKPESGSIVIYNLGKYSLTNLKVILINDKGESFDYALTKIAIKTGEIIKYNTENALSGALFSGKLQSVTVECSQKSFPFIVDENNNFKSN